MSDMNQLIRDRVRGSKTLAPTETEPDDEPAPQPAFGGRVLGDAFIFPTRRPSPSDRLRAMVANRPRARGEFRAG